MAKDDPLNFSKIFMDEHLNQRSHDNTVNDVMHHLDKLLYRDYRTTLSGGGMLDYDIHGTYKMSYKSMRPNEILNAIHEILIDPAQLANLLAQDHNIRMIIETVEQRRRKMDEKNKIKNTQEERLTTEKYEEAVDIVDDFNEQGVDTLDEEQREVYDEMIEIITQYESS